MYELPQVDQLQAQMVMVREAFTEIVDLMIPGGTHDIAQRDPRSGALHASPEFYQRLAVAIAAFVQENPTHAATFLPKILRLIETLPGFREQNLHELSAERRDMLRRPSCSR